MHWIANPGPSGHPGSNPGRGAFFKMVKKGFALVIVFVLVINLIMLAMGLIRPFVFWVVVVFGAVLAYKVLPKIK